MHAHRIEERLGELGEARNPFQAFVGFTETMFGQMLALGKAPFDLLRGSSTEEKVLKNAKDAYTTEALEIATYAALERLARKVGDTETAELAASIRGDEERMLERIMGEIPHLTDAVVGTEIGIQPSPTKSRGARADAARETGEHGNGTTQAVVVSEALLPIAGYRSLSAEEIVAKLSPLSQGDLERIESYERQNENRSPILTRISALRHEEPWPGYDELTVAEIEAVLNEGDYQRARAILDYERLHKNRPSVVQSAMIPARFLVGADQPAR